MGQKTEEERIHKIAIVFITLGRQISTGVAQDKRA